MPNRFDPPQVRTHKTCPRCRKRKRLSSFEVSRRMPDGRHSLCRPCKRAYERQRRKLKPPKARVRPVTQEARDAIERSDERRVCTKSKPLRFFSVVGRESGKPAVTSRCRACKVVWLTEYRKRIRR